MALGVTTSFNGLVVQNSYVRVKTATCNKKSLIFELDFFADAEQRVPFKTEVFDAKHDLDGENAIKQAYLAIKKMPQFANAFDC